jgi:hypothetical protein
MIGKNGRFNDISPNVICPNRYFTPVWQIKFGQNKQIGIDKTELAKTLFTFASKLS